MQNDNSKFKILRKKYSKFIYENFNYRVIDNDLKIVFYFSIESSIALCGGGKIEPDIYFKPEVIIKNIDKKRLAKMRDGVLDNLVFHLGLMEIPSYWKATCSPEIEIRAGYLNSEQIKWWKNLIINGMGQFFYENKIDFTKPNFLKITSLNPEQKLPRSDLGKLKNRYLVPFAGGRDSIVTLESLKRPTFAKAASFAEVATKAESADRQKKEIALFMVNPTEIIKKTAKVSGIRKQIIVKRTIDKKLLDLNKRGYLNGHTPFTSLLSFISVLCAVLFDYKNIAFSNEKSANEGNVKYLGKIINHQWAKSSEFEKMFQKYCKRYLAKNINYFSYLRKYGELEISKMLIKYPQYFSVFSSCNAGMKISAKGSLAAKERWCGNCPKCLFVYMSLYPFLEEKELLEIFGRDIFQNKALLPTMYDLLGQACPPKPGGRRRRGHKPFECVGTEEESRRAFKLSFKKAKKLGEVPYLLTRF